MFISTRVFSLERRVLTSRRRRGWGGEWWRGRGGFSLLAILFERVKMEATHLKFALWWPWMDPHHGDITETVTFLWLGLWSSNSGIHRIEKFDSPLSLIQGHPEKRSWKLQQKKKKKKLKLVILWHGKYYVKNWKPIFIRGIVFEKPFLRWPFMKKNYYKSV